MMRSVLGQVAFPHTFSLSARVASPEDENGNVTYTYATAVANLPGRYRPTETVRNDEGGMVTVYRPSLALPYDSPVRVGDRILSILSSKGSVILDGPLSVQDVATFAPTGPIIIKRAFLVAGDVR